MYQPKTLTGAASKVRKLENDQWVSLIGRSFDNA